MSDVMPWVHRRFLILVKAIWSVQNGLGTFFGSSTGGRLSKREVTQGPQSHAERQKRKKKKKKKKAR